MVSEIVKAVKEETNLPVMPKLSPNVTDIVGIATAAECAGADAISMINTLQGMAVDIRDKAPGVGKYLWWIVRPCHKTCSTSHGLSRYIGQWISLS